MNQFPIICKPCLQHWSTVILSSQCHQEVGVGELNNSIKLQNDDMYRLKLAKTFPLVPLLSSFSFLVDQRQSSNDLLQKRIPSQPYNLFQCPGKYNDHLVIALNMHNSVSMVPTVDRKIFTLKIIRVNNFRGVKFFSVVFDLQNFNG